MSSAAQTNLILDRLRSELKTIYAQLLVDASPSIWQSRLDGPMVEAVEKIRERMAEGNAENRMHISLFATECEDLNVHPGPPNRMLMFCKPSFWRDFGARYRQIGRSTALDIYLAKELSRLGNRHEAYHGEELFNVTFVLTDGRNNRDEQVDKIRRRLGYLKEYAEQNGGIGNARVAIFYQGIGLTEAEHQRVAFDRYQFPPEWFDWQPATEDGVLAAGESMASLIGSISTDGGTVFGMEA